jgi:N-formylglutamate amidohydrolase
MPTFNDIAAVEAVAVGPIVAVGLHAAHRVRPEVAALLAVSEEDRLREEDPYTELWAAVGDVSVVARRSRFEVDLNRVRERAVYLGPEHAWGLDVWRRPPSPRRVAHSLALYDAFYAGMRTLLDDVAARCGRFVVLDIHTYNHRRAGPDAPVDDPLANPELNVGTVGVERNVWLPLLDRFVDVMRSSQVAGRPLDVRENVRFKGGCFMRWVNAAYPGVGCALTLEWKKTFMDEWTGRCEPSHVSDIAEALARVVPELGGAVRRM